MIRYFKNRKFAKENLGNLMSHDGYNCIIKGFSSGKVLIMKLSYLTDIKWLERVNQEDIEERREKSIM